MKNLTKAILVFAQVVLPILLCAQSKVESYTYFGGLKGPYDTLTTIRGDMDKNVFDALPKTLWMWQWIDNSNPKCNLIGVSLIRYPDGRKGVEFNCNQQMAMVFLAEDYLRLKKKYEDLAQLVLSIKVPKK